MTPRIVTRWVDDVRWESNSSGWYVDATTLLRPHPEIGGWKLHLGDSVVLAMPNTVFTDALDRATSTLKALEVRVGRIRWTSPQLVDEHGRVS